MSNPQLTEYLSNANVRKFLDMLSAAEGTTTHGYNTLFGGNRFDSLGQHPRQSLEFTETTGRRNRSDAAGRYGFLSSSWDEQAKKLGLKDFGPMSQDLAAINLLRERNILPHILNGEWDVAIQKSGPIWASLPSSPYPQPRRSREFVMNELNNPSAASAAPTKTYSTSSLMKALEKARAANDSESAFEIQSMLQGRLENARKKAEAAGDTEAVQELTLSLQRLPVAVGAPVAPPTTPQAVETPPPGAAPMGTPTQAPDYDPSQRDMGGLGTTQAAPEAPVAPVAAPAAPTPELSPAAAPAAPPVSDNPAPSAVIPTTTVTASTAQPDINSLSVLQEPGAAPAQPEAPATPKPLTDQQLATDPAWISNAKKLYQETNRKPFGGSDAEAADWLKSYMANSKHNLAAGVGTILDLTTRMTPEGKQAFLDSYKKYDEAPTSGESVWRAVKAIGTDPTTYASAGLGSIFTKTLGKKAMEKAIATAAMEGIRKQVLSSGTKQGLTAGAGYGATSNLIDQGQQIAADGQESIDPTKLALSTGIGAVTGGAINKLTDSAMGLNAVRKLGRKSGSEDELLTNAEIITKVAEEAGRKDRTNLNGAPNLRRQESNARVSNDIVREAQSIIKAFPNDDPNKKILLDAASRGVNNSQRELDELAQVPGGPELVEIISKAVKAKALTAPDASSQNFLIRGARTASDWLLPGFASKPINYMLKPRSSSEEVTAKLLKNYGSAAQKITGFETPLPSPATRGLQTLREMQQQAAEEVTARRTTAAEQKAAEALAKKTAQEEAKAAAKAQDMASRNSVLQATGMPLGGPFQELLQGGRSGLNLTTDQAVEALRIAANKNKGNPIGEAANQVRRSSPEGVTDTNAFYGLQNELRKLQERGVLGGQPGALSEVTQGSGIRNPISYAANVRTAEAALKVAQESAPNNALAQFANVVARTKSPEAKAALVQQRLLKATDQTEIDYLTNFIEPLTRFGAKSK